jgi:hypothetical protein
MNTVYNVRIQLLATALNNLGVGAVLAGVVVPSVSGSTPAANAVHLVIWLMVGVNLVALAQDVLGMIFDYWTIVGLAALGLSLCG